MSSNIIAAKKSPEMMDYLLHRRSVPINQLRTPGPDDAQISDILKTAARTPDHGKLFPWYFIVFKDHARKQAGDLIAQAWQKQNPDASPAKLDLERERFLRAPLVIGVISRIRPGKYPLWEQVLSAGAVCYNLCLAANAQGFGSNWLTEWYAYDKTFRAGIGLDERDHIAGLIYIGTAHTPPEERERPLLERIVTYWRAGQPLNKGDDYDRDIFGYPKSGFDININSGDH